MKITKVEIKRITKEDLKVKAFASVVIDDVFIIKDIRVIEGENGKFIAFPSRKNSKGEYYDVAHPLNIELREEFEKEIFKVMEENKND